MLQIELNGTEPKHVERIAPVLNTDDTGDITWVPSLLDYDASIFYRGKQVTNEEFNELFLHQVYQGNYIADSLSEILKTHLGPAIHRKFTSTFNLLPSFTKTFGTADWGAQHEDGYYYITITAEEHGFKIEDIPGSSLDKMNIDTEMYVLDAEGQFHEVSQIETDPDNTVRIYTDDNTLSGFVVIRTNDKAYALAATTIDATQVQGLAKVATSAKYKDLIDIADPTGPDTRIAQNAADILKIISGESVAGNARYSDLSKHSNTTEALLLNGTIQGIPVNNIFEEGSNYVKDASHAIQADKAGLSTIADYASADFSKGTIEDRLNRLGFKEGYVTATSDFVPQSNKIIRQGNYCILHLTFYVGTLKAMQLYKGASWVIGNIYDTTLRPKSAVSIQVTYSALGNTGDNAVRTDLAATVTIATNGVITLKTATGVDGLTSYGIYPSLGVINVGYEANPRS